MTQIGGFFELEEFRGEEFHTGIALNTGRNALAYLIRVRGIRRICLPYYLCDTVAEVCSAEGVRTSFYRLDDKFLPAEIVREEDVYLYLVNYFGLVSNEQILRIKQNHPRVIVDNAQAFFRMPVDGVDTIYSCRKFFGVPDGAYLYTDADASYADRLERDVSKDRFEALLGRYEGRAQEYYAAYRGQCELFRGEPLKRMSALTHNLLRGIDYGTVRERRSTNYEWLRGRLGESGMARSVRGAFAFPFYCRHGQQVRRRLAERGIYVPVLWPGPLERLPKDWREHAFAADILPLPCDQRYEISDMKYLAEQLEVVLGTGVCEDGRS